MLQIPGLGIKAWKHLLRYEKNQYICLMCYVPQHYISFETAKLKPQLFLNHFHIQLAQTGARQFGSRAIYTVPCLGMDLVILIFFCAHVLCLHCEDSGKERERGGKKTSLTEAQSIISQVFDWSDCKRSRQFPRAPGLRRAGISQEQNPIQQKWRNSSFE